MIAIAVALLLNISIIYMNTVAQSTPENDMKTKLVIPFSNASGLINSTVYNEVEVMCDLPNITHLPFVGRHDNISAILTMMSKAHIISITGAPGFGKSTLAIHVGYKALKLGISVRYIDVIDSTFTVYHGSDPQRQTNMTSNKTFVQRKSDLPVSVNIHDKMKDKNDCFDDLLKWSKTLTSRALLILDNCDDQLIDSKKTPFIVFLQRLIANSNQHLHIILTSELHMLITDDFESLKVKELSLNESIELITLVAPRISTEDALLIVDLVERCPLALKVIGNLLHNEYEDQVTDSVKDSLRNSLIKELNKPPTPKERFGHIMSMVLERIKVHEAPRCGYSLSLFPGSFKHDAALRILPTLQPRECLSVYQSHSLLDRYVHFKVDHYKMHKLIKEYMFIQASKDKLDTGLLFHSFNQNFEDFFTEYVINYVKHFLIHNLTEDEKYYFHLDDHNINYLISILLNQTELSTNDTHALVGLVYADMLELDNLRMYFQHFMEQIIVVCNFLGTEECRHFYPNITSVLLNECECDYNGALNLKRVPCNHRVWCGIIKDLNEYHRVFMNLDENHQAYLHRIQLWYCRDHTWTYMCFILHKLNTLFYLILVTMGYIRLMFPGLKGYLSKYVYICGYVILYTVCSCSSIFAPTLALAFEKVVSSDLVEVLFLLINVVYVQFFFVMNKFKYSFILWNVTVLPLVLLMCFNKQHLDDILRICLFNAVPYIFLICTHAIEFYSWIRYVSFCSFVFSLTVICMGDKTILAIMTPYVISCFLNMSALFLAKPLSSQYVHLLCCFLLFFNILFSWNIFPLCL